jgi:hypothetical protein
LLAIPVINEIEKAKTPERTASLEEFARGQTQGLLMSRLQRIPPVKISRRVVANIVGECQTLEASEGPRRLAPDHHSHIFRFPETQILEGQETVGPVS